MLPERGQTPGKSKRRQDDGQTREDTDNAAPGIQRLQLLSMSLLSLSQGQDSLRSIRLDVLELSQCLRRWNRPGVKGRLNGSNDAARSARVTVSSARGVGAFVAG